VRKQRIGRAATASSQKELVFAPRSNRQTASRIMRTEDADVAPNTRGGSYGRSSGLIPIRNASDAAKQQAYIEAAPGDALDDVTITFRGTRYPWRSFYFPLGTYLEILTLRERGALPPFIAVEVRRDIHPKLRYQADEIPCRPADDRPGCLRVTPVVKNRIKAPATRFDDRCVVIAETNVEIVPGARGWSFATALLVLTTEDFIAPR
jgi:hypothetical protein